MADNDNDNEKPTQYEDEEQESGLSRWMSTIVVLLAVAGFFGLAWYAYKSGGEAVDDKEVELVKADKEPVKETPASPGGMQIPNQDKTVYGLVGGNTEKPNVERILPAPEEPMKRADDTETWMSDKAKTKTVNEASSPQAHEDTEVPTTVAPVVIAQVEQPPTVPTPTPAPPTTSANPVDVKTEQFKPEKAPAVTEQQTTQAQAEAKEETPPPSPVAKANAAVKSTPASMPAKGSRAQLGAYKSEAEAKSNWNKIAKKFDDDLNGKEHYVLRADLGSKGIYYRLQVGPFGSPRDVESFCVDLVSEGQGCIPVKAK